MRVGQGQHRIRERQGAMPDNKSKSRALDNALKAKFKATAAAKPKDDDAEVPEPSEKAAGAMQESATPKPKRVGAPGKIKVESVELLPQPFVVAVYEGTTQVATYPVNRKASKYLSLSDRLWRSMVKYAKAHKAADLVVVYAGHVGVSVDGKPYDAGSSVMRARTDDLLYGDD